MRSSGHDSIDKDNGTSDGLLPMSKIHNLKDSDFAAMSEEESKLGDYKVYIPTTTSMQ